MRSHGAREVVLERAVILTDVRPETPSRPPVLPERSWLGPSRPTSGLDHHDRTGCETDPVGGLSGACLSPGNPGSALCDVCCGPLGGLCQVSRSCRQIGRLLHRWLRSVTPISLTTRHTGLYSALKQYKGRRNFVSGRQQARLADLVGSFLERHGDCVAPDGYDAVAVVPSLPAPPNVTPRRTFSG